VRRTLCELGDMHFRVAERPTGGKRLASGLGFDAVGGSIAVRGVDTRYDGGTQVNRGDVVVRADGEPIADWAAGHCLRPGSTPAQRELNLAQSLTSQWRIEEEKPEPEKLTLARPGGGTYTVAVKWRSATPPRKKRACVSGKKIDGKVGVLTIHTFACPDLATFEQQMTASLDEIGKGKDLIVDVRENGGGNDEQARAAAQRFLDTAPAWMRYRHHTTGAEVAAFQDEPFEPGDGPKVKAKRIWLLTGPGCASTCEIFASVMSVADHVTVVGAKTAGGVGNPKRQELASGMVVTVPSTEYAIPGTELLIEAHGIWPDVEVLPTVDDVARGRDPVLDAALRRIADG
jgi:C-terminal processing protease CtpA/Prc